MIAPALNGTHTYKEKKNCLFHSFGLKVCFVLRFQTLLAEIENSDQSHIFEINIFFTGEVNQSEERREKQRKREREGQGKDKKETNYLYSLSNFFLLFSHR